MSSWRGRMALGCHPPHPNPASPPAAAPQTGVQAWLGAHPVCATPPHPTRRPHRCHMPPAQLCSEGGGGFTGKPGPFPAVLVLTGAGAGVGIPSVNASLFIPPQVVAWRHRGTAGFALGWGVWLGVCVSGEYNLTSISPDTYLPLGEGGGKRRDASLAAKVTPAKVTPASACSPGTLSAPTRAMGDSEGVSCHL